MRQKVKKTYYGANEFYTDVRQLAEDLKDHYESEEFPIVFVFGVPQGGTVLAATIAPLLGALVIDEKQLKNKPPENVLVVDDIIDSGSTRSGYLDYNFAALHGKPWAEFEETSAQTFIHSITEDWIVYWWEGSEAKSIDDSVLRQLQFIGEDVDREGLKETPGRVIKSWDVLYGGYKQDPKDVMKVFTEGSCDEMVLLKDIEFFSTCEHHMLPFHGKAHIAYIPDGKVIGISKLARLLEIFARRLQIQERIGQQVTEALMTHLEPKGAACILEAQHFCMTSRGVQKQNSKMITSSLTGAFREIPACRAELMGLVR